MCRIVLRIFALLIIASAAIAPVGEAWGQGVTTGEIVGTNKDPQGALVPGATITAVHQPSGKTYEGVSRKMDDIPFPACGSAARTKSAQR
jgi:hypothetical protein